MTPAAFLYWSIERNRGGEGMIGTIDQELLLRIECLATDNRIPRSQLKPRLVQCGAEMVSRYT